jgi:hypothetical protein
MEPVRNYAGGVEIKFVPESHWIACREGGAPHDPPKWMRFYVAAEERRDESGVRWVRFVVSR